MKKDPSHNSASLFRIAIILTAALFGLFIAQSLGSYFPKQYRSSVTLQIKNIQNPSSFGDSRSLNQEFLAREFRLIQSKEILYPVIDVLQLQTRWIERLKIGNREQAYQALIAMISLTEIRNTELIQISITESDPKEAAEIANAVATEYQMKANIRQTEESSIDLEALKSEIAKQKAKTEALRVSADQIRSEAGTASEKYLEAENNHAMALKILNAAEQRLRNQKIDSTGNHSAAVIWEKAEPSLVSVSLPTPLRLTAGIILGTLIGLLLCLFARK